CDFIYVLSKNNTVLDESNIHIENKIRDIEHQVIDLKDFLKLSCEQKYNNLEIVYKDILRGRDDIIAKNNMDNLFGKSVGDNNFIISQEQVNNLYDKLWVMWIYEMKTFSNIIIELILIINIKHSPLFSSLKRLDLLFCEIEREING
ncbi:TPA: hypothetical protein ON497_003211, partial [Morganella morganii]|nr:hypothetical protein [Morganella morganii]